MRAIDHQPMPVRLFTNLKGFVHLSNSYMLTLASAEVFSYPILMACRDFKTAGQMIAPPFLPILNADVPRVPADKVEISGLICGRANPPFDLTLNFYRCARANPLERDSAAFATQVVDYAPGNNPGAEMVTNGDFATDTVWEKEAYWSIASGAALHDSPSPGLRTAIRQTVSPVENNDYLLTVGALGSVTAWSDEFEVERPSGMTVQVGHKLIREYNFLDQNIYQQPTRIAAVFRWLPEDITGVSERLEIATRPNYPGTSGPSLTVELDDVGLRSVTANIKRFSRILDVADVGDSFVVGFAPGGDMTNHFVSCCYRRFAAD